MLVELDVFSGRPNPRWELDEPASRELRRLESALSPATLAAPEPPGLGYRGFVYSDPAGTSRAYGRHVRTAALVLADPDSSIERFLLARMPEELAPLRPRVARELEGGGR
jgi:hypothetical protein